MRFSPFLPSFPLFFPFMSIYGSFLGKLHVLWSSSLQRLFCNSINPPCAHVWNTIVSSGLVSLVATWNCYTSYKQNGICSTVGPSIAVYLEPLAHCQNIDSLSLFYRYYFSRCSSELAQLVPLPFSCGKSNGYSDRLHDSCVTISRCYKDNYFNSFFPCTASLWNSVCKMLSFGLRSKSRINRHLLTVGTMKRDFLYALIFLCFFFLVTPCLVVAVQPFMLPLSQWGPPHYILSSCILGWTGNKFLEQKVTKQNTWKNFREHL